jgi:PhzF family phenazine biosynthesis protein
MSIPYYQIDTFTSSLFKGNPTGVCLLADWLPDAVLQSLAAENNLAETAFVVQRGIHSSTCAGLPRRSRWTCAATQLLLQLT